MTERPPDAPSSLSSPYASPQVPAVFAEKAMASLMQLHGELMEEKERRVDLYRRLMEKEQAVAELRMYVRMLEEQLGHRAPGAPQVETRSEARGQPSRPPRRASSSEPNERNEPNESQTVTWTEARRASTASPKVVELPPRAAAQVRQPPPAPPVPPTAANDGWKAW